MGLFDTVSGWLGTRNDYHAATPDKLVIDKFNAPGGQNYSNAMTTATQQGAEQYGQANQGYGQQQDYIRSLQDQAAGNGPSVAQQMLQRATQQNMQNNASAIASQRGMNPALANKLLLDQNAATQQNAAGQGAQMRAGEMLNAQGLLGQAIGQARGQSLQGYGQAGQQFGRAGGLENQAQLGAGDINLKGQLGAAGINNSAQLEADRINAGVAAGNASTNLSLLGSAFKGASSGASAGGSGGGGGGYDPTGGAEGVVGYRGGEVPGYAGGGEIDGATPPFLGGPMMLLGGPVPGRAKVAGNSLRNDTVQARLSPGEIVLPRTVTKAEDAPEKAAAFVRAVLRRKSRTKTKTEATLHHVRKAKAALDALAQYMGDE